MRSPTPRTTTALALLLLGAPALAQDNFPGCTVRPETPRGVCQVIAGFGGSQLVPQYIPTLEPQGILGVQYDIAVAPAQNLDLSRVANAPNIFFNATAALNPGPGTGPFVLLMVDPDAVNPSVLHWLLTGLTVDPSSTALVGGQVAKPYWAPAPPEGTDLHRYTFLLYSQPSDFSLSGTFANPSETSDRIGFDFPGFVQSNNLRNPVGGNFMRVGYSATTSGSWPAYTVTTGPSASAAPSNSTSTTGWGSAASSTGRSTGTGSQPEQTGSGEGDNAAMGLMAGWKAGCALAAAAALTLFAL